LPNIFENVSCDHSNTSHKTLKNFTMPTDMLGNSRDDVL